VARRLALALKMIWISDNTATDHLLHVLGREQIERQMKRMAHGHVEWNTPLLSTREMTMLRDKKSGLPGREYDELDVPARRQFLAKRFSGVPDYEKLDFDAAAYTLAEWYASPMDMARALAWLKSNTEPGQPAHALRAILAVDPKLPHDAARWPYVGFKGGSEDQLMAGNWLLQHADGRWFTMHLFWNSPDAKVDQQKFIDTLAAIFSAVEQSLAR
jgi:beta-lactamase class A